MDFDDYDDAPEDELNRILWADVMGVNVPYPTPIHRAAIAYAGLQTALAASGSGESRRMTWTRC